ncbi:MAG TPA: LysR family transcriptional regulator [Polyangiaceae bacterium]|nr:LysR family transcriptional regulator [Polyangiaceae bacterium]
MDHLDALRLFTRLAERKSFSAAAADLKIKQSTASKWVAELEARLGVGLVERTTRSLRLTDAGRRFLAHAGQVLAAFDEMTRDLREQSPEPAGRVRLSVPVVFGRLFVAPAAVEFLRRHPKVEAELVFNDRYVNLVEEGFDLAVRVGVPADTAARGRRLAEGRRVLVASPAYLRARGRPETPAGLKHHECLVHGDATAPAVWRFAREGGAEAPVAVRGRLAANNSEAVLLMARSGLGVALLADWLVERDLRQQRLVPLLEGYRAPPAPIVALTPPGRFTAPAVRAFVDHLAASLAARLPATSERAVGAAGARGRAASEGAVGGAGARGQAMSRGRGRRTEAGGPGAT